MKARAIQRNVHVSSQKANLVCDLIRYKRIDEAITILDHTPQKTAKIIKKILTSAIANATNNHAMVGNQLYIYQITANQGTTVKRSLPRAKGSSDMIRKRHSHLEVILSDDPKQKEKDVLAVKIKKSMRAAKKVQFTKVEKPKAAPKAPVKKVTKTAKAATKTGKAE